MTSQPHAALDTLAKGSVALPDRTAAARRAGRRRSASDVGLGAVATTFIAGVENVRRGAAQPFGSLTQMGTIRLGKRTDKRAPLIKRLRAARRASTTSSSPRGIRAPDDAYDAADQRRRARPRTSTSSRSREFLTTIKPMPAAFDREYVKRLEGDNVNDERPARARRSSSAQDIRDFKRAKKCDRLVMIWCASTEIFIEPGAGAPEPRSVRAGDGRQRPVDRAVDALRLGRASWRACRSPTARRT